MAKKVDILCRPTQVARPHTEEHGALEHETLSLSRPGETIDQAFDRVLHEDRVEVSLPVARYGE
jgi:hypothetical protein